jgi:4a-hydroxytetrahydrobiopterin dehydratase
MGDSEELSRPEVSAAVEQLGWRVLLTTLATSVEVPSLDRGLAVAAAAATAGGDDAERQLRVDVRRDRVELVVETTSRRSKFARRDVSLAERVTDAVRQVGFDTIPDPAPGRPVQALEIAIDAIDIARIRPFWKAVMGYGDEPGGEGPTDAIVDPVRQGPSIWFQQMDAPRPQRNRIHFDIVVAHDEADRRRAAALAAGGTLVSDAEARAFWILADAEGNEICICTWQDREGG